MKRIFLLSLLCGVCVCSQAQYYLNVFKKNGTKVEYLISDLDSVTFSNASYINPVSKKFLSKLSYSYIEKYKSNTDIVSDVVTFKYDNQNRVSELSSRNDGTVKLDYSNGSSILVKSDNKDTIVLYQLDNSGYVKAILPKYSESRVVFERNGDYVSKMSSEPVGNPKPGVTYMSYDFVRDNGVVTHMIMNGYDLELPYRYNYLNPAINVDLNWFIFSGGEIVCAPMWLGYCGKISDRLFEFPGFMYTNRMDYEGINTDSLSAGTYHYEKKYYELDTSVGSVGDITMVNDSEGYPVSINYSMNVAEYIYSYDYVVEVDTIAIKEGEVITNKRWHKVSGTEKDESTGRIVGTNDIVYSFEYKQ